MKSLTIIGMSILGCVIYGILHDQVTARLCVEYLTIFHAPIFGVNSPTTAWHRLGYPCNVVGWSVSRVCHWQLLPVPESCRSDPQQT